MSGNTHSYLRRTLPGETEHSRRDAAKGDAVKAILLGKDETGAVA